MLAVAESGATRMKNLIAPFLVTPPSFHRKSPIAVYPMRRLRYLSPVEATAWIVVAILSMFMISVVTGNCTGHYVLKSASIEVVVNGSTVTVKAIDPETKTALEDYFTLNISLTHILEKKRTCNATEEDCYCDWGTDATDESLQTLAMADFNCSIDFTTTTPQPGISLSEVRINYTRDDYPDFYVLNTWYSTTHPFTVQPSSNRTFVHPSKNYTWVYEYVFARVSSQHHPQSKVFTNLFDLKSSLPKINSNHLKIDMRSIKIY